MKTIFNSRLIFLTILVFTVSLGIAQKKVVSLKIDSTLIYKSFDDHGTTGGLRYNHHYLDSTNHEKTKLSSEDQKILQSFCSNTKDKKLFQTKYGGDICYILVYSDGVPNRLVATSNDSIFQLDNLDHMRYWQTGNPTEVIQLNKIIMKYWR